MKKILSILLVVSPLYLTANDFICFRFVKINNKQLLEILDAFTQFDKTKQYNDSCTGVALVLQKIHREYYWNDNGSVSKDTTFSILSITPVLDFCNFPTEMCKIPQDSICYSMINNINCLIVFRDWSFDGELFARTDSIITVRLDCGGLDSLEGESDIKNDGTVVDALEDDDFTNWTYSYVKGKFIELWGETAEVNPSGNGSNTEIW